MNKCKEVEKGQEQKKVVKNIKKGKLCMSDVPHISDNTKTYLN